MNKDILIAKNYKELSLRVKKYFIDYFWAKKKKLKAMYTKKDKIMYKILNYKKKMLFNQ